MSVDDIKKELEEVRRLKEELKSEISGLKDRMDRPRRRRSIHYEPPEIDLSGLSETINDLMENISEQLEHSMSGVKIAIKKDAKTKAPKYESEDIESIPPERVARIISPLGSEERLRILDYLKSGSKTFNEMEVYTGKTGSSLTHHLNPLQNAGYVIKGEVRGTYYVTVEGRLAYRLAQWLTDQVEGERLKFSEAPTSSEEGWL